MLKQLLRKLYKLDFDGFKSTFNFYRFNPHSIPTISKIFCKLGRHDYEAASADTKNKLVNLYCFYCLHKKSTRY